MDKQSFLEILDRYQQGRSTEKENRFISKWYSSLDSEDYELSPEELTGMSGRVLQKLRIDLQQDKITLRRRINWYKTGIAASIAIAMICCFFYANSYNNAERAFKNKTGGIELISKTNNGSSSITIELSDHSKVTLQPNATVSYPIVFMGMSRLVYLKGNAFFSVSKNRKKPFYVYNKSLRVMVLGTSFFINEASAEVTVRTGKVQVNENMERKLFTLPGKKQTEGVLVTPNQKAVFNDQQHHIDKSLVERPVPLAIAYHCTETENFNFNEASLTDVFHTLSKAYGIEITVENNHKQDCTFTGDLDHKGLFEQLNLICQSVSGSYLVKGTRIFIRTKQCN